MLDEWAGSVENQEIKTPFARLRAKLELAAPTYTGIIFSHLDVVLSRKRGFKTMQEAKAWCITEYARLLADELARTQA